jgi:Protein of unknown function (DUF3306)
MNNPEESLLLRWSRRKHEARQHEAAEKAAEPVAPAEAPDVVDPEAAAPRPAAESELAVVTDEGAGESATPAVDVADLPDVETLTYESDFTAFLRENVPEQLKQAALRKLWTSDPVLANLDGLNDYDPKTMTFLQQLEGAAEAVAEVGRGLRDKIMEAKRAREERPRGPHRRPSERREALQRTQDDTEPGRGAAADQDSQNSNDVGGGDIAAPDERRDN